MYVAPPKPDEHQKQDGILGMAVKAHRLITETGGGVHMRIHRAGGHQVHAVEAPDRRESHEERRLHERQQTQQNHAAQRLRWLADQPNGQRDSLPHEAYERQPQNRAAHKDATYRFRQWHLHRQRIRTLSWTKIATIYCSYYGTINAET